MSKLGNQLSKTQSHSYYFSGVRMNISFDGLAAIAAKLGANLKKGDILFVDNVKGDKRKAMCQVDINGRVTTVQVYARIEDNRFEYEEMRKGSGRVSGQTTLLDFI